MRVLAVSTAGAGHFAPMTPFLGACVAAGHEVLCAAPEALAATIERRGWRHASLPSPAPETVGPLYAELSHLPLDEANRLMVRDIFGSANVDAALPRLDALVEGFRPDLVLREAAELASHVVASRRQVEQVQVAIGLQRLDEFLLETLDGVLEERYDVASGDLRDLRTVSLMPPSLETPPASRLRPREHYRAEPEPGDQALPGPWAEDDPRPLVYVSFGTVAAGVGFFPGLYRMVLDALEGEPVRVLMTIGREADPDRLGPLPDNAHVEQWWPQAVALRAATVAVGHGGFGTTLGALTYGVPLVVLPLFSIDQHYNAEAVAAAGAGLLVAPPAPEAVAGAVRQLVEDAVARAAAQAVSTELRRLPLAAQWLSSSTSRELEP